MVAVPTAKPQKTVHVRFRLINCLFSDELSYNANSPDSVDRAALDAGAVGSNSSFWTLCAERFNNGFPVDSIDGPLFANKVHFSHPTIDGHPETVDPSQRSTFSSSDLNSLWKENQKEYEKVFINFKKSGNHNSSFTKEAMKAFQKEADPETESVQSSVHSADLNDVFGVEEGGFCNFTNSIVVIYLQLWFNECPELTNFVSRQLPDEIQVDSMVGPGAAAVAKRQLVSDNSKLRKSPDIIADSINNLAKARKVEDGRKEMHMSITEFHHSETEKGRINVKMEEIQLDQMQLNAMKERFQNCTDSEKKAKYEKAINELDNKLDNLLMP